MHNHHPNKISGRAGLLLGVCLVLLLANRGRAQMVDLNSNGMSDVWEWVYNANGIDPNADSDGDGVINKLEALAGTNPFDSNSVPKISFMTYSTTNFSVTVSNAWGKFYQLQSVQILGDTNWVNETNLIARSGTTSTLTVPANGTTKYFRISVADVDTDGDGVSDWEEYKLGLDPFSGMSNGLLDFNGQLMGDYAYVTNKLASQNVITISATDPITFQPDPGQNATDLGLFTVTRGGFPLNSITVGLALDGSGAGFATPGVDYLGLPSSVVLGVGVSSVNINVTPLANTNLVAPVVVPVRLLAGARYTLGSIGTNAGVLVYPSITASGTGLTGQYFTNANATFANTNNFNTNNLILTRTDPAINFNWTNGTSPNLSNAVYSVRWLGQVQPQYSEVYFFVVTTADGARLSINDQVISSNWVTRTTAASVTGVPIALQAGVRYDLKMEYFTTGGPASAQLSWYSASQPQQLIPTSRLYPTNDTAGIIAPPTITSPLTAVAFLGQPFTNVVTAANAPIGFSAKGLPPGLSINTTNGVISGTPTLAGDFAVTLTATNAAGIGSAMLDLQVLDTGSSVVREVWQNIPGVNVSDIPLDTPATLTNTLGTLEGITDYGDNYGERIRGYITAPVTGNYYFWVAASNAVELWISNDSEPANKVKRNFLPASGTGVRQWTNQPSQKSPWLALVAGQKYYFEILHKAGVGSGDNLSVGWLQDPSGTNTTPAGVVPGYVLSRYYPTPPVLVPGTLYTANMLALPGVNSIAVGSATLRVSADGSQAILNFQMNNLAGAVTAEHIDADPYLGFPAVPELFDISVAHPQPDGSYVWKIKDVSPLAAADILEIIAEGKASIKIETSFAAGGELGGHFTLANGSQTFTPPPAPPAWADDSTDPNGAVRFLTQATFGASSNDIVSVQSLGYAGWINNQFSLPVTHALPTVIANRADPATPFPSSVWFNTWWRNSVTAPDQLRQRVAFALSEIMVASENGTLQDHSDALAYYYDTLLDNSFGNFRTLLKAVTLTPTMGVYLNMQGNTKGNIITGTHANENYAREINQLFSIGLNRMWPDGTLVLSSSGNLVPTYNQNVINGFAATFTGWNYYQTNQANGRLPTSFSPAVNYINPMVLVPSQHDLNSKLLLDNIVLPPALGSAANSGLTNYDYYCSQDLEQALDAIYNNQNVGPYICRQLIQRLVTSNPSRDYLYRVVQKFNDNGAGVRGDMAAVVQAILLDYEARSTNLLANPTYGKQRESLLRVTATARAFPSPPSQAGTYSQNGTQTNTITTTVPHRLNTGDTVPLSFLDGNPAPSNQNFTVTALSPTVFTVTMPNLVTATYSQNTNFITVTNSGHGLLAGNPVYLAFTTGTAISGQYFVSNVISSSIFVVATTDSTVTSGRCLLPKTSAISFVQTGTNVVIGCSLPHGLFTNATIFVPLNSVFLTPGVYQVTGILDAGRFTIGTTNSTSQTQGSFSYFPLDPPPLTRAGNAVVQWSTWKMGYTDSDGTYNLGQSPLSPNTVFNFFFPNYAFPGPLSAAGLTTPEFQLTSDTSVALQMNFLEAGLLKNIGNTNGLSSFASDGSANGSIVLDIGPWMTMNYTAATNVPVLVDSLNTLLLAGQLSAAAKTNIVNYVTNTVNFPYTTPVPTATQMRDRVRAVVHLIICSPDFTIQK